jgi:iron complex outermembrane recepter protein
MHTYRIKCARPSESRRPARKQRRLVRIAPLAVLTRPVALPIALGVVCALDVSLLSGLAVAQEHVVSPPLVNKHVDAVYPTAALVEGKHADVVLVVTVDVDGHVSDVKVRESGGEVLDEAATIAVRQWTFESAKRDGKAVASRILVPFHFAPPAPPPEIVSPPQSTEPVMGGAGVVSSKGNGGLSTAGSSATAHVTPTATPTDAEEPEVPTEVTVTGRALTPGRGASDFTFDVGSLAAVPRKNSTQLLTLAPGILLTNEGGDGHAEQVFLRGFDAREGQDIEFSVGGVPINEVGNLHGNGYADTHFIIPELVETFRVIEGPFDPRQGNFAVAGSANYELGLAQRGTSVKGTFGSFGTQRLLLLWGPSGTNEHTFGGAELFKTDGFGQNRDSRRGSAMGQYEGSFGGGGLYRITGTAYADRYHSAGVLRDDDVRAGKIGFYDTYDSAQGGDGTRFTLSGDAEVPHGNTLYRQQFYAIARGMGLKENFTGFLLDPQEPIQNPHVQRGDLIDMDMTEGTVGARGSSRTRLKVLGRQQEVEVGYFARGDSVQGTQRRIEASTGHPYRVETDLNSRLANLGLYVDGNLSLLRWLSLRGGVRGDLFTFNVQNNCAAQSVAHPSKTNPPGDASCLSQENFGAYRDPTQRAAAASTVLLPRGSIILGPFRGFSYSVSFGEGTRSIDPSYVAEDTQTPFARVTAYEMGAAYSGGTEKLSVTARSVFFQTKVDRDLIFSETAGRNILGGGTTRTGWLGAVRLRHRYFDEAANITVVKSTFDDTHLLVPYVPDLVMRSDTALMDDMPFHIQGAPVKGIAGLGITYVGHRALPYGQRSDVIFTLDASATLRWSIVDVGIAATNLLDRRYRLGEFNYASDFDPSRPPVLSPVRHFSAGAPRALFATLGITWGLR